MFLGVSTRLPSLFLAKPFLTSRPIGYRLQYCCNHSKVGMPLSMPQLIDIGANLTDPMFQGAYHGKAAVHRPDLPDVLQRAWDAGVTRIVITATNLEEAHAALELAGTDERLFCTAGVHPTRCTEIESHEAGPEAYWEELRAVLRKGTTAGKVVALGECGLDADRTQFCDMQVQERWFERHFELARDFSLPMFLHLRAAAPAFLQILERQAQIAPIHGVVHSFDGTLDEAQLILSHPGLFIGLNGCSLKTEANLEVVRKLPANRLLLETDAPWCEIRATHASSRFVSTKWQAKDKKKWEAGALVKSRNEPCNLVQVLEAVAGVRGTEPNILAATVLENTMTLFFSGIDNRR